VVSSLLIDRFVVSLKTCIVANKYGQTARRS